MLGIILGILEEYCDISIVFIGMNLGPLGNKFVLYPKVLFPVIYSVFAPGHGLWFNSPEKKQKYLQ